MIFNRSWYNRAGVELVMGFSTPREQQDFLRDAPTFEQMLVEAGIRIVKFWLDISKKEQAERLEARRNDPLKALKVSDMDEVAQKKWKDYSKARDEMLLRTHTGLCALDHRPHRPQEGGAAQGASAICCTPWRRPRCASTCRRRTRRCSTASRPARSTTGGWSRERLRRRSKEITMA